MICSACGPQRQMDERYALHLAGARMCQRQLKVSVTGDGGGSNGSSSRPDHEGMTSVPPGPAQHQGLDQSSGPSSRAGRYLEGAVDQQHTAGVTQVEKLTDELGFSPFVLHDIALHR